MNLNEIKEALSKATPGPWELVNLEVLNIATGYRFENGKYTAHWIAEMVSEDEDEKVYEDANLIAKAPEWLASLVAEVERLKEIDERESLIAISIRNENQLLKARVEEMQKAMEWAARIIDSGMGAGILRYDPVEWFIKYHTQIQSLKGASK